MPKRTVRGEAFFTSRELAVACMQQVGLVEELDSFSTIIEPSAGSGAFLSLLPPELSHGIDVDPQSAGIFEADFLTWDWHPVVTGRTLVVGNPPFGQRASLAFAFLERAALFADVIAFILPRSFNKWTFQNRFPSMFHLVSSMNCDDFVNKSGESARVKCVFQVWRRGSTSRPQIEVPRTHPHFDMKHGHLSRMSPELIREVRAQYDFALPQVGANFKPRDVNSVTQGSYWFIRPNVPQVRDLFANLDFSFLDDMNVAHKSLSKGDIVLAYQAALQNARESTNLLGSSDASFIAEQPGPPEPTLF